MDYAVEIRLVPLPDEGDHDRESLSCFNALMEGHWTFTNGDLDRALRAYNKADTAASSCLD